MRSRLSADSDLSCFEVKRYYVVILKVGCSQSENKGIMSNILSNELIEQFYC